MEKINVKQFENGYGKTEGDKREFALCGFYGIMRTKHDSGSYDKGSDIELDGVNISVKASGATLMSGGKCIGCNTFEGIWRRYYKRTHSNMWAYVTVDFVAYVMNKKEFSKFIHTFGYLNRESSQNGGHKKIKLLKESQKMINWLDARVA